MFLLEAVILSIHSPPFVFLEFSSSALQVGNERRGWHKVTHNLDSVLCTLAFLRLYLSIKIIRDSMGLTSEMARSIAVWYEEDISSTFVIRAVFYKWPIGAVMSCAAVLLPVFAYVLVLFERDCDPSFNYATGLWFVSITATTVGYGDVYPHSSIGRVITILLCVMSLALFSLMICGVISVFQLTIRQQKVVHLLNHSHTHQILKQNAAECIAHAWRIFAARGQHASLVLRTPSLSRRLRSFRTLRKDLSAPMHQATDLLFREMLTIREHSEDKFTELEHTLTRLETQFTATSSQLDAKMRFVTEQLAIAIQKITQQQKS